MKEVLCGLPGSGSARQWVCPQELVWQWVCLRWVRKTGKGSGSAGSGSARGGSARGVRAVGLPAVSPQNFTYNHVFPSFKEGGNETRRLRSEFTSPWVNSPYKKKREKGHDDRTWQPPSRSQQAGPRLGQST